MTDKDTAGVGGGRLRSGSGTRADAMLIKVEVCLGMCDRLEGPVATKIRGVSKKYPDGGWRMMRSLPGFQSSD